MERKIDLEIRLREVAAQSMLEARNEIDVLEVEKSLLTSDQRMNCYAKQLEMQRKQLSNPSLSTDSGRGSKSGNRRADVIGANLSNEDSSPSFSSLSNSQSPAKLSPVSNESTNSPSFTSSSHHSRAGLRHSSSNTLNGTRRARNKKRQQLVQSITSLSNINCNMVQESRASLSISEIRVPLMWRDVDHFKNRGDYKRFACFCLLKIDSQIFDTQLISDVDRQVTDVTFDDLLIFNDVQHNFELTLEVYSCVYLEQFSLSSTPRKLKEKLSSSVSRAMGRRLATQTASANYTKELQAYDKSYRFDMIASATLKLDDAAESVKTYDLVLVSPSAHRRSQQVGQQLFSNSPTTTTTTKEANKNTLPLFGHFCCKLLVRPNVFDKNIKTGYLRVATISIPETAMHNSDGALSSHARSNSNSPGHPNHELDSSKLRMALAASSKMATLSMSSSCVYWALLRNFTLHLWQVDEKRAELALIRGEQCQLDRMRKPNMSVNIDRFTRLLRVSNSSLTLETEHACLVLGIFSDQSGLIINQADEIAHWLRVIEQFIYDSHIWGSHLAPHR